MLAHLEGGTSNQPITVKTEEHRDTPLQIDKGRGVGAEIELVATLGVRVVGCHQGPDQIRLHHF